MYARIPGPFPEKLLQDLKKASYLAAVAIEHHLLSQHMVSQSKHDALTGLGNRVLFREQLQEVVQAALMTESPMALLFIDVNDFKSVNDSLGHLAGDQVLSSLAQRLLGWLQEGELLGANDLGEQARALCAFLPEAERAVIDARGAAGYAVLLEGYWMTARAGEAFTRQAALIAYRDAPLGVGVQLDHVMIHAGHHAALAVRGDDAKDLGDVTAGGLAGKKYPQSLN